MTGDSAISSTAQVPSVEHSMLAPVYIAWEIENLCNLSCRFCYSSSWNLERAKNGKAGPSKPSMSDIKAGLGRLRGAFPNLRYINWTGGEPLLRAAEMGDVLAESTQQGFRNIVSTNGYFSKLASEFANEEGFLKLLDSWSEHLDVLSLSLDSADEEINNATMRVLNDRQQPFRSSNRSAHFNDAKRLLDAFKSRRFPFSLKVNTMVTRANKQALLGMVELLADVPCFWHLIEFNPRQCPPENIAEFQLEPGEFAQVVLDIDRAVELSQKTCKFFVTTRQYDGDANPYCFLVINSAGQVLLPYGHEHKEVAIVGSQESDDKWREGLQRNIAQLVRDSPICENGKDPIEVFNQSNRRILSRYLHRSATVVHTGYSLQWLREIVSSSLQGTLRQEQLVSQFAETQLSDLQEHANSLTGSGGDSSRMMTTALLLEQPRVGRFIHESWGIVGGTLVLLPESGGARLAPCVSRRPPGLHIPWCFRTTSEKRQFFREFFRGGVQSNPSDSFSDRSLPTTLLTEVARISCSESSAEDWKKIVEGYLSDSPGILGSNDEITVWIILTRCIEAMLGEFVKQFHGDSPDSWIEPFVVRSEPVIRVAGDDARPAVIRFAAEKSLSNELWKPPSGDASSESTNPHVLAALWLYLFDPLLKLGYDLPDTYAFRLGGGAGHLAVGAVFMQPKSGIEALHDPLAVKRRIGGFLEALAGPTIAEEIREIQIQATEAQRFERDAKVHTRIRSDLDKLLLESREIGRLATRIETSLDSSRRSFLSLHHHLSLLFMDRIQLFYPEVDSGVGDVVSQEPPKTPQGTPIASKAFTTTHSTPTPDEWLGYSEILKRCDLRLQQNGWLADIGKIGESAIQVAFNFLKIIIHRPHNEIARLYEHQACFALRLATLNWKNPPRVTLSLNPTNEVFFKVLTSKTSASPDTKSWLSETTDLRRKKRTLLHAPGTDHTAVIADETDCATLLGSLMQLVDRELRPGSGDVLLQQCGVYGHDDYLEVRLTCSGEFKEGALYLDERSAGRGLRSCILTLCRAANQRQPVYRDATTQNAPAFEVVTNGGRTTLALRLPRQS